jgi:hypothetical protein
MTPRAVSCKLSRYDTWPECDFTEEEEAEVALLSTREWQAAAWKCMCALSVQS